MWSQYHFPFLCLYLPVLSLDFETRDIEVLIEEAEEKNCKLDLHLESVYRYNNGQMAYMADDFRKTLFGECHSPNSQPCKHIVLRQLSAFNLSLLASSYSHRECTLLCYNKHLLLHLLPVCASFISLSDV